MWTYYCYLMYNDKLKEHGSKYVLVSHDFRFNIESDLNGSALLAFVHDKVKDIILKRIEDGDTFPKPIKRSVGAIQTVLLDIDYDNQDISLRYE